MDFLPFLGGTCRISIFLSRLPQLSNRGRDGGVGCVGNMGVARYSGRHG